MDDRRKPARPPTFGDRNEDRRWASPALGVPEQVDDEDCTGKYDDLDERRAARAKRPTDKRIERLEDKHDELALTVAGMDGKVTAIFDMTSKAEAAREAREKAEATERADRRRNLVPIITALGAAIAAIAAALVGHFA